MDRHEWKSFFSWLDTASVTELRARHTKLVALLDILRNPDVRADARRMQRLIEQRLVELLNDPQT